MNSKRTRMVIAMEYSAGSVSQMFAFVETKVLAKQMVAELSKEEINAWKWYR
jgi:hypothetical protein